MEKYKLDRAGEPPLVFTGQIIAESKGKWAAGKEQNRWHDLCLYRTQGGKYVLEIYYQTHWEGELGHRTAFEVSGAEELTDVLRVYAPAQYVQGFPDHPQYEQKQHNLVSWIVRRYESQVSELLGQVADEFGEKID